MRNSRSAVQCCYLEYNKIRQKRPDAFVAFLEGHDAPYYLPFIESVIGARPEQVICHGKQNVIDMYNSLLEKKVYRNAKTGFFVDRDFDDNSTLLKNPQHFYVTKGYSIENYYCSKDAFERILVSHMHYNCGHKDYDALVENYVTMQKKYNDAILEFNAWYCTLKRNKIHVNWSLEKTLPSKYIAIDFTNFVIGKNYNMTMIHKDFKVNPQPSSDDVRKNGDWIMLDPVNNMRGKYEFAFLLEYLKALPNQVNSPSTGFAAHDMKYSISDKDALSALAQYADKDDDLADYICKRAGINPLRIIRQDTNKG